MVGGQRSYRIRTNRKRHKRLHIYRINIILDILNPASIHRLPQHVHNHLVAIHANALRFSQMGIRLGLQNHIRRIEMILMGMGDQDMPDSR
ncbi:hypothetical protein D3C71_1883530 [compost metagenome]